MQVWRPRGPQGDLQFDPRDTCALDGSARDSNKERERVDRSVSNSCSKVEAAQASLAHVDDVGASNNQTKRVFGTAGCFRGSAGMRLSRGAPLSLSAMSHIISRAYSNRGGQGELTAAAAAAAMQWMETR